MRRIAVLALAVTLSVLAPSPAEAAPRAFPKGWYDLFPPPYSGVPGITMAIAAVSDSLSYVPGGSSNQGFTVFSFDNAIQGNFTPLNVKQSSVMEVAIAAGGTTENPKAVVGGMGFMGTGVHYMVNKTTLLPSDTGDLMTMTQDVRMSKDGSVAMVMDSINANVLLSTDSGKTFVRNQVNVPELACNELRYGAIVDANTQYVSLGTWPNSNSAASKDEDGSSVRQVSERLQLKDGKLRHHAADVKKEGTQPACDGYMASIAKTTDGGKTWKAQVNMLNSTFYFNGIDCFNATLCLAVGEGMNDQPGGHIYRTTDGETWKQVFFQASSHSVGMYSFMSVRFAGADGLEAWVGGSLMVSQVQSSGLFFHTVDGGATWENYAHGIPNLNLIWSLDTAPSGVALATAMTVFDDSTILRYDPKGVAAPGNFVQSQCVSSACRFCQNATFPQAMCLQLNGGGSAVATCSASGLTQTIYTTPDCTGTSQSQTEPTNKCLSNGNGGYFENYCLPGASEPQMAKGTKLQVSRAL